MPINQAIKVIAFDADDTLWDNEPYFRQTEDELCQIMAEYRDISDFKEYFFGIEMDNMPDYGYGAVAFTMSLIESSIKYSDGKISASDIGRIIELGRKLVRLSATPLAGVAETLKVLHQRCRYQLVVFTKGELLTQENKLKRSGLLPYFDRVFITTDKQPDDYRKVCREMGIAPEELVMVGNSLRSDIQPALEVGASAIYIPSEVMWQHEIIEHFEHERMFQIVTFSQILDLV